MIWFEHYDAFIGIEFPIFSPIEILFSFAVESHEDMSALPSSKSDHFVGAKCPVAQ